MIFTVLLIALAAFTATMLGGLLALRLKDQLHLILGFSAGAVIAVAFFEIIPEAIKLSSDRYDPPFVTSIMGLGFLVYLLLDRFILLHSHREEEMAAAHHHTEKRGSLGAGSLSLHSFLDGIAVGLAFKVSPEIGAVVASAVLVHDFSDGINTVNLIVKNGGNRKKALVWVATDALAPVLGVVSTFFFVLPASILGLLLAVFAGTFTYIGAADLLPESHHAHPKRLTTIMTVFGMVLIYAVVKIAG